MIKKIPFRQDKSFYFVSAIVILGVIFRIWASQPTWMHYDENYYINIAQNYADRGGLTPYMWRLGDVNILSGSGSGYAIVLLAFWMRLVGESLFWGRILMVLAGLAASGLMYLTARIWWGSRIAGMIALLFGVASTSSFYTLVLRMDALGVLAYCILLLLHIYAVRLDHKWLHLILGIIAVLALEFHILGLLYLISLLIYYSICYLQELISERRFVLNSISVYFGVGVFLAALIYAVIHVLPDPEAYFIISKECFECNEAFYITEFKRIVRLLVLRPHEVLIFAMVLAAALLRKSAADRHYLMLAIGWLIAQAIVGPPPYAAYSSHLWPLISLGAAGLVDRGFKNTKHRLQLVLGVMVAFVILCANLVMYLSGSYPFLISYRISNNEAMEYVRQAIPKETVIMGRVPSFYPLREYRNFVTYRDGELYGIELRSESLDDFWQRIQPQVVLLEEDEVNGDEELRRFLKESEFAQVMPNLWITEEYFPDQTANIQIKNER